MNISMKTSMFAHGILLLASLIIFTPTSFAATVSAGSQLLMGGGSIILTGSESSLDLSNAEGISFTGSSFPLTATANGFGDFSPTVTSGETGTIEDFSFDTAGINNFIDMEGWVFNLQSVTIITQTSNSLQLLGTGSVSGNGFDATAANWSFSTNTIGSYSTTISAVPVPAAIWLFGSGLLGLAGIARRRNIHT